MNVIFFVAAAAAAAAAAALVIVVVFADAGVVVFADVFFVLPFFLVLSLLVLLSALMLVWSLFVVVAGVVRVVQGGSNDRPRRAVPRAGGVQEPRQEGRGSGGHALIQHPFLLKKDERKA